MENSRADAPAHASGRAALDDRHLQSPELLSPDRVTEARNIEPPVVQVVGSLARVRETRLAAAGIRRCAEATPRDLERGTRDWVVGVTFCAACRGGQSRSRPNATVRHC